MKLLELITEKEAIEERLAIIQTELSQVEEKIESVVAPIIKEQRSKTGKDTGVINVSLQGVEVKEDIPKKVIWDQEKLRAFWTKIQSAGDKPEQFMEKKTIFNIPEKQYSTLPAKLQSFFNPARTVKPGKPKLSYKTNDVPF